MVGKVPRKPSDIGGGADNNLFLVENVPRLVPYFEWPFDGLLSRPGTADSSWW